jgi:site-specific DNA-methyltransferase (adenine-specific)
MLSIGDIHKHIMDECMVQNELFDLSDDEDGALYTLVIEQLKNVVNISENNIYNYNCVEGMKFMPENYIDLVVTSPPYDNLRDYNGYEFDYKKIAEGLFRVIKKGGVVIWVVADRTIKGNRTLTSFKHALAFQEVGFNVHDVMIYKKKNTPFMRSNAYTNCFEYMFVFAKGSPKTFNPIKVPTVRNGFEKMPINKKADGVNNKVIGKLNEMKTKDNIWEYAVGAGGSTNDKIAFQHTAIFPEKLSLDHILSWSNENDLVFDPMCGSGTVCKIAMQNNRNYIGMDISKEYVELSKKRVQMHSFDLNEFK